jgi:hypothetical protein
MGSDAEQIIRKGTKNIKTDNKEAKEWEREGG